MSKREWYVELSDDDWARKEMGVKYALKTEERSNIPLKARISYSKYIGRPEDEIWKDDNGDVELEEGSFAGKEYYEIYNDPEFI